MSFYDIKKKKKMNNTIKLVLSIAGVASLIGFGYFYKTRIQYDYIEVKRGDVIEVIRATGKIAAAEEIDLAFQTQGKINDVLVKPGDFVAQGATLAKLNAAALEAELKKSEAQIELAKTRMSQLLAGTRSEEIALAEAKAQSAKVSLDSARQEFENVKIKADNDLAVIYQSAQDKVDSVLLVADIADSTLDLIYQPSNNFQTFFFIENFNKRSDAEWQIIFTRDAYNKIKEDHQKVKLDISFANIDKTLSNFKVNLEIMRVSLLKTSEALDSAVLVSGTKPLEDFKSEVTKARASINSIQTEILKSEQEISAQKILNQMEVSKAQNLVKMAESNLKTAEDELALKKAKPRDIEIAVYEAQLKEAEASRFLLKENIKHTVLTASINGIVTNLILKKGETAASGYPAVSIMPDSSFQVETTMEKEYAKKLNSGDRVDIFINDQENEELFKKASGHVVSVNSQTAEEGHSDIIISFDESGLDLKFDTQVDLEIHATLKRDVIVVSEDVIYQEDGEMKATLLEDGVKKETKISIGEKSGGLVEVLSGLYEGDRIVR